jgi:hypothetical protein
MSGKCDRIAAEEIEWITNDYGELGVKVRDRFVFLYKGHSLEYKTGLHDDGSPMLWRHVYKREFGECCHPVDMDDVMAAHRAGITIHDATPDTSTGDWQPLPAPLASEGGR